MISLVASALRARRAQTLALFLLTVLAAVGGSAAPWFSGWARQAVASADIAAAPAQQRLVTVSGQVKNAAAGQSPVDAMRAKVGQSLRVPGDVVVSMSVYTAVSTGSGPRPAGSPDPVGTSVSLGYRDDVCANLTITAGSCPGGGNQVLLSRRVAAFLGVGPGTPLTFTAVNFATPITMTVSGVYDITDVLSPYWASGNGEDAASDSPALDGAAYTNPESLLAAAASGALDLSYQVVLPPQAYHDSGEPLLAALAGARADLQSVAFTVQTSADTLVDQIRRDQRLAATGIEMAAIQLVLLCWFALYLAVRYTSDARRPDIGLLKLRGTADRRVWTLTGLQSAVPMVAGAAIGWAAGLLACIALAGQFTALRGSGAALPWSLAVAAGVALGALAVSVAAETRTLRSPITTLMRRVPDRRTGWRNQLGDLAVVLVAVAGVYQGYADLAADGTPSVIALLAPGLVGLAVALVVARALPSLARWSGTAALRAGRPGPALSALHVARRPGTQRVFVVLAVAVCVLATTTLFWQTATQAWSRRAEAEVGAARVLTVRAGSSAALLAAVRAADPSGRYAMAVARGAGTSVQDRVLAVDSSRLAAVALLTPEFGLPDAAGVARALHPAAPTAPTVSDGRITLDASGPTATAEDGPLRLTVQTVSPDGVWHEVTVGPLGAGRQQYQGTVTGCPHGCRLVALNLVTDRTDAALDLFGLAQSGQAVVTGAEFADISRWRSDVTPSLVGPRLDAKDGRLRLTVYDGHKPTGVRADGRVFVVDGPTPIPAVLVGDRAITDRAGERWLKPLGADYLPYQVVATGRVLPSMPAGGLLVDLEYVELASSSPAESVGLEVWLTADAPTAVLDGLRRGGVEVTREVSVASVTQRLRSQGPGVAMRFELFAAGVLLLVAAGTIIVSAAVERRPRAEELAALRAQGLADRTMRVAAYLGTAALTGGAIVTGLLAALVGEVVVTTSLPVFTDSWTLLPAEQGSWTRPLSIAVVAATAVLGGAAVIGAGRTVRSVRSGRSVRNRRVGES